MEVRHGLLYFGGTVRTSVKPTRFQDLLKLRGAEFYEGDEFDVHANYVAAEALTYVMYFQHRDRFNTYLNGLKSGADAKGAWREAVGPTLTELENDYYRFFRERGTLARLPAPSVDAPVDIAELTASEVHTSWASLFQARDPARARREAELAVQLDELSAEALIMRARLALAAKQHVQARADLERALALEPPRSIAFAAALRFSLVTGERLSLPNKVLAERLLLFKLKPSQSALVAEHLRREGDFERGITLISQAIRADSSCFYCYATGSRLLEDKGDLALAASTLRIALSLAGERATGEDWERLHDLEAAAARELRSEN
jgi:tetratricopeptide (TPR) repeat protein